ncbi:MAG TPA: hypothetical protein VGB73_08445 [Pyrinomonadaceae bacterium]|jgi:hypothetical protein
MAKKDTSMEDTGITKASSRAGSLPSVQLFGRVTLVEAYALPNFEGCHALVALRDTPGKTVAVLTSAHNLQNLLETALATGNLMAFRGSKVSNPPTPLGGTWAVDVYLIDSMILYNIK